MKSGLEIVILIQLVYTLEVDRVAFAFLQLINQSSPVINRV